MIVPPRGCSREVVTCSDDTLVALVAAGVSHVELRSRGRYVSALKPNQIVHTSAARNVRTCRLAGSVMLRL